MTLGHEARRELVDRGESPIPLAIQAELLGISRASLYYQPVKPDPATVNLYHRIDEIYTDYPFYGSRRITAVLQQEGYPVNRKRIQRAMREMGIAGLAPGQMTVGGQLLFWTLVD